MDHTSQSQPPYPEVNSFSSSYDDDGDDNEMKDVSTKTGADYSSIETKAFCFKQFVDNATHNIEAFRYKQGQTIAEIDKYFESLEHRIQAQRTMLVESVKEYTETHISRIEEYKRLASEHLEECVKLKGDPVATNTTDANTVDPIAFFDDSVYDISFPAYKVPRITDDEISELIGKVCIDDPSINYLPPPKNIKVVFESPVSGILEWDKQAYHTLFDKLNSENEWNGQPLYNINDLTFIATVNDGASTSLGIGGLVKINLIPGMKHTICMTAVYQNIRSTVSRYEFVSQDITPEFYQGSWSPSNTSGEITLYKSISKSTKDLVPVMFVCDTPLRPDMNNFWALSFTNDTSPEKILLAGLVPKRDGDDEVPEGEGFFSAVQKGWFVSVHTGLLLGSDSTPTPNGKSCGVSSEGASSVLSLGFGIKNRSLVFGSNIGEVKGAIDDESKMAFKELPDDVPLFPAVIVASSNVRIELCYPS